MECSIIIQAGVVTKIYPLHKTVQKIFLKNYQNLEDVTNIKEPAFVYIDDRAIKFDGDFSKTITEIENFKPHWKNY